MSNKASARAVAQGLLGDAPLLTQVAIVCRDLQKTMESYTELLGWGPWNVYRHEPPRLRDTMVRGERVDYTMLGAEAQVGTMGFELLQPLEGPSIYKEWLDEHGEGLHHLAVMAHDFSESGALRSRFAETGSEVLMEGRIGETIEFFYVDTQPALKVILESGSGHAIDLVPDYTYP